MQIYQPKNNYWNLGDHQTYLKNSPKKNKNWLCDSMQENRRFSLYLGNGCFCEDSLWLVISVSFVFPFNIWYSYYYNIFKIINFFQIYPKQWIPKEEKIKRCGAIKEGTTEWRVCGTSQSAASSSWPGIAAGQTLHHAPRQQLH